jgi:hypothetical protein
MSGVEGKSGQDDPPGGLVIVHVRDEINHALAGHAGIRYDAPPQCLDQALALARVVLGYSSGELNGRRRWACPIASGRRIVWLDPQLGPNGLRQSSK